MPDHGRRLTIKNENITTVPMFWQVFGSYSFQNLRYKDSAHFFKRGIKPVWEDSRNKKGGAWVYRMPNKAVRRGKDGQPEEFKPALEFLESVLMATVGRHFDLRIHGVDDQKLTSDDYLCGISISNRDKSSLISIWNRHGDNKVTKKAIFDVVNEWITDELRELLHAKTGYYQNCYYKKHSEHKGYDEVVAKAKDTESVQPPDVEVKLEEREAAISAYILETEASQAEAGRQE